MEDNASSSSGTADSYSPSYLTIRVLISLGSVVGNSLVIYLVTTVHRLRTPPNWFVLSLAVADFSVGFVLTPIDIFLAYYPSLQWYTMSTLDVIYDYIIDVAALGVCAVIYDRYLAITKPLRYHTLMTKRHAIFVIMLAWLLPALMGLPLIAFFFQDDFFEEEIIYRTVLTFLFQFLPSAVMMVSYVHILLIVREHSRQTAIQMSQLAHNQPAQRVSDEPRVVLTRVPSKLVGSLIILFVFCYAISVFKTICFAFDLLYVPPVLDKISLCLIHFNSLANFAVYALLKKDIRNELKGIFRAHVVPQTKRGNIHAQEPNNLP